MAVSDTACFALALDAMDGVGRVTAGRLLAHFATYADLLRYPHEQVLTRIKGAPRSTALVSTLFDQNAMATRLEDAEQALAHLHTLRVKLVTQRDPAWLRPRPGWEKTAREKLRRHTEARRPGRPHAHRPR